MFVAILIFNGTYFRIRPMEDIPAMDWLVLARLITSALAFCIGVILIIKSRARFGFGSIVIFLFLVAAALSALNSSYPMTVIGYALVFLGAGILVIGLVQRAQDVGDLEKIERIWFLTMVICILKDAIMSYLLPDTAATGDVIRLGMGISHANSLSLLAAMAFWLSFKQNEVGKIGWFLRIALIIIIIGALSRVSILAFLSGGFIYFFLRTKVFLKKWIFVLTCLSGLVIFGLILSLSPQMTRGVGLYAKRGNTEAELASFSARTLIWKQVIHQWSESPLTGHGFGVTRLTLQPITYDFQAAHCHNEFLETLFGTGILGLIPLVLMYIYSIKWIIRFSRLKFNFSPDLASHAVAIIVMFLASTFFEARISAKLLPFQLLFFFYLVMLDREKYFFNTKRLLEKQ